MGKGLKRAKDFLSPESLDLFRRIEESFDDLERKEAIRKLAATKKTDDARALMEAFELCLWRETKKDLLRAIGSTGLDRSLEFLQRFVEEHGDDLPLVTVAKEYLPALPASASWPKRKREPLNIFFAKLLQNPEEDLSESEKIYALKWLAEETHPELAGFVQRELLGAKSYLPLMLGIAAAKRHSTEASRTFLIELLAHENRGIVGRALDSLTPHLSTPGEARLFWTWFWQTDHQKSEFEKTLVSAEPKQSWGGGLLLELKTKFQALLAGAQRGRGLQDEDERDLCLRYLGKLHSLPSSLPTQIDSVLSELDQDLSKEIRSYPQYPEAIKSVLRNAEMTWKHPELFVEGVDKSTMVIELTKALDLSLNEAFLRYFVSHRSTPHKLQSHLMRLNLDRPRLPTSANLIETLKCKGAFTPDVFPLHKMSVLCGAIMSGKLFIDPERFIDGLRSWGVLLLIFGRSLAGEKPLIPIQGKSTSEINQFCKELNYLQDIRNRAVHRESAIPQSDLAKIRKDTFRLLDALATMHNSGEA